jgi:hypothetical protein
VIHHNASVLSWNSQLNSDIAFFPSHVGMSTAKLLSRIVSPEEVLVATGASMPADEIVIGRSLHQHTFGLTSDPLAQFACVFSALIHGEYLWNELLVVAGGTFPRSLILFSLFGQMPTILVSQMRLW